MKKTLLSTAAFICAGLSYGQVTVDWSVDEIISPATSINSSAQTGTKVDYHFVLKNNGTDDVLAGDTVLYQMALLNGTTPFLVVPNGSFYFKLATKTISTGDTMHISGSFSFGNYPTASVNINFGVLSHVINRSRNLGFESSLTNNQKVNAVTWYNPQGWPVSTTKFDLKTANVFPNVVKDNFTVSIPMVSVGQNVNVKIYTVLGVLVAEKSFSSTDYNYTMDASGFANGTYLVRVESGDKTSTAKIVVQK